MTIEEPGTEAMGMAIEEPGTEAMGMAIEEPEREAMGMAIEEPGMEAMGMAMGESEREVMGMVINKIGWQHLEYGRNCQDYGFEKKGLKVVCDGCSEGMHSEVGAKAFCHLLAEGMAVQEAFDILLGIFGQTPASIRQYLCFTILMVQETEAAFIVSYCGDGYILKVLADGSLQTEELSDGKYPKYFAYRYIDRDSLSYYKDGVDFETRIFPKSLYRKVGIASDGLRFAGKAAEVETAFMSGLQHGREVWLKRLINKHQTLFQDDITIVL